MEVVDVCKKNGGIDVCINNAGLGEAAPLLSGETDQWRKMLDVSKNPTKINFEQLIGAALKNT